MTRLITILLLFSQLCFAQSDPEIIVTPFNTTKQVYIAVKKSEVGRYAPMIFIGSSPYGEWGVNTWLENDSVWFTYLTLIYVKPEADSIKFQAKDFSSHGGSIEGVGREAGKKGVLVENDIVGFFNTGDWIEYKNINLTGKQKIKVEYSYGLTDTTRELEIREGSITGPVIAKMSSSPTASWDAFVSKEIPITIDTTSKGSVNLFFVVKGTENASSYWGNLKSITIL